MTIEEMAEKEFPIKSWEEKHAGNTCRRIYCMGANAVLEEIEKELRRRMLEDYNEGAEEDEVAQGCIATMVCFIEQLKKI